MQEWLGRLAVARADRDNAQQDAKQSDLALRQAIKDASKAGLSAPQIADAVGLSAYRVYQIRNGRRS